MPDILEMLKAERDKLDRAIEALGGQVGSAIIRATARKKMSAAARARIAAGQKARWAKAKLQSAEETVAKTVKKYTLSSQARANIAAGARKRWAKIKAGK
jgi:hypothetical protein